MRRWISWVRPPGPLRSREVRSTVARGSMAYSAVTHPSPLPFLNPGTPVSTRRGAVHQRAAHADEARAFGVRVGAALEHERAELIVGAAIRTGHGVAPRGRWLRSRRRPARERRGRRGPRSSRRPRCGRAGSRRLSRARRARAPAISASGVSSSNRTTQSTAASPASTRARGLLAGYRPLGALAEPADRRVGVEADHERVAFAPGGLEQLDVARVQQVEHAVGEHHRTRRGRAPGDRLGRAGES